MYSKRCNIALCLCILLHLIYHKDKTGVVHSKRCNIAYVIAYCCIRYIRRTKLVLYIQKGAISPTSLHFAASDISYFRTRLVLCIQKIAISPCLCILLHDTCTYHYMIVRGARWLSGRVSDSGARGPGFETYRRRVVSLSKTLYSPKVLVNYPGSDGSVPIRLKNC